MLRQSRKYCNISAAVWKFCPALSNMEILLGISGYTDVFTGEIGADALPIIIFVRRTRQTDDRPSVSYCVIKKNK